MAKLSIRTIAMAGTKARRKACRALAKKRVQNQYTRLLVEAAEASKRRVDDERVRDVERGEEHRDGDYVPSESESEEEEDMLDLAFGLTHTSRLGCQIRMTEELDGLTVTLPSDTRNMMVDR